MTNPDTDMLVIDVCVWSDEPCPLCCAEHVAGERWNSVTALQPLLENQ